MKGKFKILSLILTLTMVATMFAACKPSNGGNDTENVSSIDTTEEVNLLWYHWGDDPKHPEKVIKALNEQSKKDINTTVDFKFLSSNDERMKKILSTGEPFDIGYTCSWFANYTLASQQGQLRDITTEVKKLTPKLWESMPESVWEGAKVNGKIYAVPTYKDIAGQLFWLVNQDYVFDEVGAKAEFDQLDSTYASATPLLEKIKAYKDSSGKPYPNDLPAPYSFHKSGLPGVDDGWDHMLRSIHIGVKLKDAPKDAKPVVQSLYTDKDFVDTLKTLKQWKDKGLVDPNATTTEKAYEFIIVQNEYGWEDAKITAWGKGAGKPYNCEVKAKDKPYLTTSSVTGSMQGIGANSKNPLRALKYLEYINTDANYRNMLAYGIEGETYVDNGDGTVSYKEGNDDWKPGLFSQATFMLLKPVAPAPADMYKKIDAVNKSATPSQLLGFSVNTEGLQTQIAACENVVGQYKSALFCGAVDDVDATLSTMLKELDKNGYNDLIKNIQKQVDTFLANK